MDLKIAEWNLHISEKLLWKAETKKLFTETVWIGLLTIIFTKRLPICNALFWSTDR